MPDEYQQSPHINHVGRDANYHFHEAPKPTPFRPQWGWIGGIVAVLALGGGTLATTQLNAQTVYYCASHNSVKYHTDATCAGLQQCGTKVKSMPLGRAKSKMDLCKVCHQ